MTNPAPRQPGHKRDKVFFALVGGAALLGVSALCLGVNRLADRGALANWAVKVLKGDAEVISGDVERAAAKKPLKLRALLSLLKQNLSPAASARALVVLDADLELKSSIDRIIVEQGEEETIDDFLQRVREVPGYAKALERLQADPEFLALIAELSKRPDAESLRVEAARAGPLPQHGGAAGSGPAAGDGSASSPTNLEPWAKPLALPPGAPKAAVAPVARANPGAPPSPADNRNRPLAAAVVVPSADAPGTHKLGPLKAAGNSLDAVRFMASTFTAMPKPNRDKLIDACLLDGVCDTADACVVTDLVQACDDACKASPKCGADFPVQLTQAVAAHAAAVAADPPPPPAPAPGAPPPPPPPPGAPPPAAPPPVDPPPADPCLTVGCVPPVDYNYLGQTGGCCGDGSSGDGSGGEGGDM